MFPINKNVPKSIPISIPNSSVPLSIPLKSIHVSNEYVANNPFINTPPTPFNHSPNQLFLLHLNRRLSNNVNGIIDKR